MTLAVFHDFPGPENGLTKFHDFPGRVVTLLHSTETNQVVLIEAGTPKQGTGATNDVLIDAGGFH